MLGLSSFVKPLPLQRCEAGFTNEDDSCKLPVAELRWSRSGFLSPDRRCNIARIIQKPTFFKNLYHPVLVKKSGLFFDISRLHFYRSRLFLSKKITGTELLLLASFFFCTNLGVSAHQQISHNLSRHPCRIFMTIEQIFV